MTLLAQAQDHAAKRRADRQNGMLYDDMVEERYGYRVTMQRDVADPDGWVVFEKLRPDATLLFSADELRQLADRLDGLDHDANHEQRELALLNH
jgi:hypothetical protein